MVLTRYVHPVLAAVFLLTLLSLPTQAPCRAEEKPTIAVSHFPDSPHSDALIEWWYANAHVTTSTGRHLAVVCAFFKFGGDNQQPMMGMPAAHPAHYLIYAVTDLDRKTQRAYSYGDAAMAAGLKQLLLVSGGSDSGSVRMLRALLKGAMPAPHRYVTGAVSITSDPLKVQYGSAGSFSAVGAILNGYRLRLGGDGKDRIDITLRSTKPVMLVGGKGETGIRKSSDMYYYSLSRCAVSGTVDGESVKNGEGWVDHQWGSSWTTEKFGWDWWGVQLDNGTDILFFQQRNLATGKAFFPLATFMDKNGHQTVTHDVVFHPVLGSRWRSPRNGARYPLTWDVSFPDQNLNLRITPDVKAQEIPILSPSGDIWEGSCTVVAGDVKKKLRAHGVAYMELVGYSRTSSRKPAR